MIDHLLLFLLLALIAEILGTMGGFGSSVFFVPIASYFLDFHSVLGITAIFHVSSNLTKIAMFRKGVNKKLVIYLGIPAVLFVFVGAYFSKMLISKNLEIGLAIFLILSSLFFLYYRTFKIKANIRNSIFGGVFSGLIAGLIGTGGAIRGITMAAFGLTTETFIATSAIIDLGVDATRGLVYWSNGFIHQHDLYLIPFLLIASLVGTYVGKRLLNYVSERKFKLLVLVLILLTGISTLLRSFNILKI